MAELGATVAGLLSLTITVIDISHRYFSNAKNATRTIKGYFRELEALRLLLCDFKVIETRGFSIATTTALEGCHSELEQLRSKLQKRTSEKAFSKAVHRLTWPFAEEETRRLIDVIHRYLDVFNAALSVDNVKLATATLEAVTRNESRAIYLERRRILGCLSTVNPYSNHTAARDKHGTSTGAWLLESSEFVKWQRDKHSSLWLNGIPGAGKTILCSTAIDFLQRSRKVDEAVLIWYFDFSDDQKQSLDALLRSLLAQACELLDQIPPEVVDLFATNKANARHPSLDHRTLLDLMKTVFASFENVLIVIDALDESCEVSNVLDLLHDLKVADFENVKWLVTSRQKREIEESLLGIQTAVVPLDNVFIDADIRCYVAECLTQDSKLYSKPTRIKQQIEDTLTEKAHGMFRWIECQLEVIRRCRTAPAIEAALRTLPETLDATYERVLQTIDPEDREHAHRALELLAFSKRPLRVEEVAEAIVIVPGCKSFDVDDRFFDCADVLSICAGLVKRVQDSNDLVLAHYSVQEFLLSHRIRQSTVAVFGLDHKLSQIKIAEACLTYLLSFDGESSYYSGIEDDYPFVEYAAKCWFEHVEPGTMDSSSMLTSLILSLLRCWRSNDGCLDWSQFLDQDLFYDYEAENWTYHHVNFLEDRSRTSAIALMCLLQRLDIALALLEAKGSFRVEVDDYGILLRYAIRESNVALFDRVVAVGRTSNSPFFLPGYSALGVAARKGDSRMMAKLLDVVLPTHELTSHGSNGRQPDFSMLPEMPLLVAAKYRHTEIVKMLLEAGADVNAVVDNNESILNVVLRDNTLPPSFVLDMIKLLIGFGADVTACRNGCNPLNMFLSRLFSPREIPIEVSRTLRACGVNLGTPFRRYEVMLYSLAITLESKDQGSAPSSRSDVVIPDSNHNFCLVEVEEPNVFDTAAVVQLLLSAGADPNVRGRLHPATVRAESRKYSFRERYKMLVQAGANLDMLGPDTGTALQAVCCLPFESPDTVTALLEAGADSNLYDVEAESPLNMAIKRGYKTVVSLLKEAGARPSILRKTGETEAKKSETDDIDLDLTKADGVKSTIQP